MINHKLRNIISVLTQKERKQSAVLMILDIIVSVADILFLTLLLYVVKIYSGGGEPGMQGLLPVVSFFFLFALKNGAGFLVYRAQCRWLYKVASRISEWKLMQYLEGHWGGYADTDPSVQMRKISYQPLEFCQHVLGGVQQIITQTVLIVLTITAIVVYNGKLFLLLMAVLLPPVILIFYLVRKKSTATGRKARASSERAIQYLQEALSGFVESNIYGRNEVFLERYAREQDVFNKQIASHSIVQGIPSRMIEVFALMGIVVLIMINRWMEHADKDNLMTIGVFMAAAYKIIPGIVKILTLCSQVNAYSFTLEGLTQEGGRMEDRDRSMEDPIESIQMSEVRFGYGERGVLEGFEMDLQRGEMMGLVGASGKGKTTVLHLLLGFLEPQGGHILVNGRKVARRQDYWGRIAYVKQQAFLMHDSVRENIVLGEGLVDDGRLENVMNVAGIGNGERVVSSAGRDISGGQRQRIAIARALYKDADLIILDEPFNELDEASEVGLLRHFRGLAESGKMVILITHHTQRLSFCHKIVSLDEKSA